MKNRKKNRVKTTVLHLSTRWFRRLMPILICMVIPLSLSAQKKAVNGIVVDTKNEPLIGVSVIVKGTSTGTVTDIDGKFTLNVSAKDVLVFSYVGMNTKELTAGANKNLRIVLEDNNKALEEVVVVGYGTVKRKDLTTAVSTVSTKDIAERPLISAASAIQGKAAGVTVMQPSGEPGAGMVVRVRGNTSITASNDPLYVVDGVPMSEINFLSPNDIESMQILKDASSSAIYGSRASNGVVLITTKSGSKGETKVSFAAYTGVTQVIKQIQSLNTAQYKTLMDEIHAITLPEGLTDQTDWFKETFRTGVSENYQLSLSSGTDKLRYFVSAGYTNEKGIIPVAYYKRYNFRTNIENQIRNWLKFYTSLAYSDYTSNGIISGVGANQAGVILSVINTPTYAPIWDVDKPGQYYSNFYGAQTTHPVENMSRTENDKTNNNRLVVGTSGEICFNTDLKLKSSLSFDRVYYNSTSFLDPLKTSWGRTNFGTGSDIRSLSSILVFDNILTFVKSLQKHNFNVMTGTSFTASTWNQSEIYGSHYANADILTLNAANKIENNTKTIASEWAIMSYLGRIAYNYDSKYLLTVNFRADGSSKLAPNHRWGYFPSASAAWRMSSEDFMRDIKWLNDLKLRGGWGQTGSQAGIDNYSYLQLYNIDRQPWWDKSGLYTNAVPLQSLSGMRNPDLTWETTTQSNIGVDISMFNSKVNLNIDAYYKYTTNLLLNVPLPPPATGDLLRNEAEMSNQGLEISLNTKNIVKKDFQWETDFNISFNRNRLEKLAFRPVYYYGENQIIGNMIKMEVGHPISSFYGYISEGVDPETGNLKFKDVDNNGLITLSDRQYIGNPNPDFTYGLTNMLKYKGLTLNIFVQGTYGNEVYNASRMETEGMYDGKNQSIAVLDRWVTPGQITYMPRATTSKDNLVNSTRFVEDGSYLRLKTLTLSYDFKGKHLQKMNISRLQPYFTAQNLFTITKYKGFDPEVSQNGNSATMQGIDWGTYPQTKSFIVGLNVEF